MTFRWNLKRCTCVFIEQRFDTLRDAWDVQSLLSSPVTVVQEVLAPHPFLAALADPDHGGPEGRIDPCGTGGLRTICDPCGPGGPIAAGAVSASAGWLPRQLVKP